ncbi:MAG: glycosyltransferase family 4 protein [bacterium]|nr:glycosyltransferase family 4 protein [bacterium]
MKILLVDLYNIANYFYLLTKFLRKKGVEADMLLASNMELADHPSWHDSSVKDSSDYPSWIKKMEFPLHPFENPLKSLKKELAIIKFLRNYDLVVCAGLAPICIQWANVPFIFISLGSDLDQLPFYGWTGNPKDVLDLTNKKKIKYFLIKHLMRRGVKRAKIVVLTPYQIGTAERLGLKRLRFLPHVLDTELFGPMEDEQKKEERERLKKELNCDLIFFQATRQVWTDERKKESFTDCKGNDKLFRGFAKFLKVTNKRVKLIVIEKGWDVEESKRLIDELGITNYVVWKKPMEKRKLVWYYNMADIVFDQFEIGVLALSAIEPMACGVPVFSYVTSAPDGFFYPDMPPIINIRTEDEIFNHLCELAKDEEKRDRIGKNSLEWIRKYCSWEKAIEKYLELYKEVLSQR